MWRMSSYAIRGKSHCANGTPCQDKVICLDKNNVTVIVLADGAGSAKMSHFGAEIVTNAIGNTLCKRFDYFFNLDNAKTVKVNLIDICNETLKQFAEDKLLKMKDLACTLLFAAVKDNKYIVGHVGDGVIGYMKNNELKVASNPDNGEFANQTVFVVSDAAVNTMRLAKGNLDGIQGFVLMSDGTEAGLYDKRHKILAGIIRRLMTYTAILSSKYVEKILQSVFKLYIIEKTRDDCSVALLSNTDNNLLRDIITLPKNYKKSRQLKDADRQFGLIQKILFYLTTPQNIGCLSKKLHIRIKKIKCLLKLLYDGKLVQKQDNGNFVGLIKL